MNEPNSTTQSRWLVPADEFYTAARAITADLKRQGDLALPSPVRAYLQDIETCQHREASALPPRPTSVTRS